MGVASVMLPLGSQAPAFNLPDVVSGQRYSLESFNRRSALLIMFICRHCPYVVHVEQELARLGRDYQNTALGILAISTAFWDACLEQDPAARAWLDGRGPRSVLAPADRWQHK